MKKVKKKDDPDKKAKKMLREREKNIVKSFMEVSQGEIHSATFTQEGVIMVRKECWWKLKRLSRGEGKREEEVVRSFQEELVRFLEKWKKEKESKKRR